MKTKLYNKILDILESSRVKGSIDKYQAAKKLEELIVDVVAKQPFKVRYTTKN